MQYDILEEPTNIKLQEAVTAKINVGWIPQGGVAFVCDCDEGWWYAQAMILTDKAEKQLEAEKPE